MRKPFFLTYALYFTFSVFKTSMQQKTDKKVEMRTKLALLNSFISLILQLVTVVCGFILPRLLLTAFGSEVNGAVSSITQFLGYISLLEAGVGGVTRAALYKPLADGDTNKISGIVNATQSFFRKIAYIFIVYVVILACSFKYISHTELSWIFTASLVVIIGVSTFGQYYYGLSYSVLLNADQRSYIGNSIQIGTVILNTGISVILLKLGCGVHVVKLASTSVYLMRPILLFFIVRKKYNIDNKVLADTVAIKQRWNGFGHHIAFYIHNNVDVMVVTVVLGLKFSSVYAVYSMVLSGVLNIVNSLTGGSEAAFGSMIAKKEQKNLQDNFHMIETLSSMIIVIFFSTTGLLITDFVGIYTNGIDDVNYIMPLFSVLFVISQALHCIKQNYHNLVLAAGHYKETQKGAFIEAGSNLVLSFLLAYLIGLPGIIIATIIATVYRTIDYVIYLKKHILLRSCKVFLCRIIVNIFTAAISVIICNLIHFETPMDYLHWVLKAIPVFAITTAVTLLINLIFYKKDIIRGCKKICGVFTKKK